MTKKIASYIASFSLMLCAAQSHAQDTDAIAQQHLKALTKAIHGYVDAHQGEMPPPVVPNSEIAPEKQLSGLVLLLPYISENQDLGVSAETVRLAKKLHESIDLKKAWDDPVNLGAAKQLIDVFQVPGTADAKTSAGLFTSHFAFVRGFDGKEDGAFPDGTKVMIYDPKGGQDSIIDGTTLTLAVGQIKDQLGPWTAAGSPTSRFMFHPSDREDRPAFGSEHGDACYFSRCDGSVTFIDLKLSTPVGLRAFVTRANRDENVFKGNLRSYESAEEWKKATN